MNDPDLQNGEEGPPRCTRLSLAETKQLICDWLDAKGRFLAEQKAAALSEPRARQ